MAAKWAAQCVTGFAYPEAEGLLWRFCHDFLHPLPDSSLHAAERVLAVLPPLIAADSLPPAAVFVEPGQEARETLYRRLSEQGWRGGDYVLLHTGAAQAWEAGRMAALLQLLLENGQNIVWLASDQAAADAAERLKGRLNIPQGRMMTLFCSDVSLTAAAAVERAALFVGFDSALAHVAAALDRPQVALFAGERREDLRPYSSQADTVWAGSAAGALKAVPLETVWQKVAFRLGIAPQGQNRPR